MTTIAASRTNLTIAADARVTWYDTKTDAMLHSSQCFKIWRTRKYLIGCAGNDDDIEHFRLWLGDVSRRRRWSKQSFEALLLSRTQLFYVSDGSGLSECRVPFHAIGSGAAYALASMNTQHRLTGDVDPALAVLVACDHDQGTREPVDVARWQPRRAAAPRSAVRALPAEPKEPQHGSKANEPENPGEDPSPR